MFAVFPASIAGFTFEPEAHYNYESTVLPMKDGLPKLKDFPAELGGSGEQHRRVATTGSCSAAAARPPLA